MSDKTGLRLKGPETFTGDSSKWEHWSFTLNNYVSNVDFRLGVALTAVEKLPSTTVVDSDWIDDFNINNPNHSTDAKDCKQLVNDLFGYLSEKLTGAASTHLNREKGTRNGLAVWQRLVARYGPTLTVRAKNKLTEILNFRFTSKDFMADLDSWELMISEYEADSNDTLQDTVKTNHLNSQATGALREHLDLHPGITSDYNQLVTLITSYYKSKTAAASLHSALGSASTTSATVNWVNKGKPGKGTGKGNWGKPGWNNWGKPGNWKGQQQHYNNYSNWKGYNNFKGGKGNFKDSGKSKGLGKGNWNFKGGKGKGGKAKGSKTTGTKGSWKPLKGHGKGNFGGKNSNSNNDNKCNYCGASGHFARDCFKRKMAQGNSNSMDISFVELQLDETTTVYAVWDDASGDYWYFDENADEDEDTVNAVTTADDYHWEWDADSNCWWFYDYLTGQWDWNKPDFSASSSVNLVWDEDTQSYWSVNATATTDSTQGATETATATTIASVTPLEAEWTIGHVGVLNWDALDDDVQVSLEDTEDEDHVALDHCFDFDLMPSTSTNSDRDCTVKHSTFDLGLADPAFSFLDCITSDSSSASLHCVTQDRSEDVTSVNLTASDIDTQDFTVKDIYSVTDLLALRQVTAKDLDSVTFSTIGIHQDCTVKDTANAVISDSVTFSFWILLMSFITGLANSVNSTLKLLIRIIFTIMNFVFNLRLPKGFLVLCLFTVLAWNSISVNAVFDSTVNSVNSADLLMIDSGAGVCVCVSTSLR